MKKMVFLLMFSAMCFADEFKIATFQEIVKSGSLNEMDLSENIPFKNFLTQSSSNVILVNKGTKLSMSFFIRGDYLRFNSASLPYITFEKDLYIRQKGKKLLYSADLITWHKAMNFFSPKPLAEIKEENNVVSVNLGASIDQK